ncbi:hypothetical protein E2I00_009428, partial [Balaenoptera physalus]
TLSGLSQTHATQQHVGLSQTVRLYLATAANGQLTSNALPMGPGPERKHGAQQAAYLDHPSSSWGLNLTEKIKKIKIVFTPTICKQTCAHGRCASSCERGDTTTLYSQSGHGHDPKSGFRICESIPRSHGSWLALGLGAGVARRTGLPWAGAQLFCRKEAGCSRTVAPVDVVDFCQIPCLNGGRCIGRDECWCPTNSTGKFCHLPSPNLDKEPPEKGVHHRASPPGPLKQSTFTLPLSNQLASANPSLVKVHIHHPPEASVQVHQVARVRGEVEEAPEENSVETRPSPWLPASPGHGHWDSNSIPARSGEVPRPPPLVVPRPPALLGRCYLSAMNGQCANPLLELTAQEDCCGSVGAFWGVTSCAPCPPRPASPVIENGQLECPQGYKRLNLTHCQADKAVSMQQGLCYRLLGPGTCTLPLTQRITKQICCCSRVGKAWGSKCENCPLPGTEAFREICPAGHGYTYSSSDIRLSMRKAEQEELTRPSREQGRKGNGTLPRPAERQPLREATGTWLEAGTIPDKGDSQAGQVTTSVTQLSAWVPGDAIGTTPPLPGQGSPEAREEEQVTAPTDVLVTPAPSGIDRCAAGATNICGPGTYDDECLRDPCKGRGRCVNRVGSYSCFCYPGYTLATSGATQECQDIDECEQPEVCSGGRCTNTEGSYHCECDQGYVMVRKGHCQDINECHHPGTCPDGRCVNSPGSYTCLPCEEGYRGQSGSCVDVNECLTPGVCTHGTCINLEGSFRCSCEPGYEVTSDEKGCQDVDECASRASCPAGLCLNTEGSFTCSACESGYWVNEDGTACEDVDECEDPQSSCLGGECKNTAGSYQCLCPPGFQLANGTACEDVDECVGEEYCAPRGECLNSHGSFFCLCAPGFASTEGGASCQDVDECAVTDRCLGGQCVNTEGSFNCLCKTGFQPSPESGECPGYHVAPTGDCADIDECANDTMCGSHGFCDNTDGSFRCLCDQGFETSPSGWDCVDVNECELMLAVCGAALCENVEGSFLCLCASDLEEYDAQEGRCRLRVAGGQRIPEAPPGEQPPGPIRMGCYSGQKGQPPCSSLLGRNTTQAECCCTQGTGWGDACELCPAEDSVEFSEICPSGKGYIPVEGAWMFGQTTYTDADECVMFGPGLCQNGRCLNTVPGYICLCDPGYHYDAARRKCEEDLPDHDIHTDICWKKVTNYVCSHPLHGRHTTYTECCCQDGEAWSQQCALCPPRSSEVYAQLCNVARIEAEREAGVHFRPGYEYGPGPEDLHYSLYGPDGVCVAAKMGKRWALKLFHFHLLHVLITVSRHQAGFEGLQAEECGILNGCENGRCVRVQEGYTCDCFEGFQLDMANMACVDVNECDDLNGPAALCVHGHCENTEGSYRCHCSPGYVAEAGPPRCTAKK